MRWVFAVAFVSLVSQVAPALAEPPASSPPQSRASDVLDARININTASIEELTSLPGIGPTRARAIVQVRDKRRFRRIEDLLRVPGIGRKTFARIRPSVRVE